MKNRPRCLDHPDIHIQIKGIRDHRFKKFIRFLLKFSNLKESEIDILLDNGMQVYAQAFTHPTAHLHVNYEFLEFLGDLTLNKAIGWVMARKFPQLHQPNGVKVMARLKIQLVSKMVFSSVADRLHFLPFISSDAYARNFEKESTLEDCFEAFFGATEMLIDLHYASGAGYATCYSMIEQFMRSVPISLKFEDLYDSKTRLKELFDKFRSEIGKLEYESIRIETDDRPIFKTIVYRKPPESEERIDMGYGEHHILVEAEKIAAEQAITHLSKQGYSKEVPEFYRRLEVYSQ